MGLSTWFSLSWITMLALPAPNGDHQKQLQLQTTCHPSCPESIGVAAIRGLLETPDCSIRDSCLLWGEQIVKKKKGNEEVILKMAFFFFFLKYVLIFKEYCKKREENPEKKLPLPKYRLQSSSLADNSSHLMLSLWCNASSNNFPHGPLHTSWQKHSTMHLPATEIFTSTR